MGPTPTNQTADGTPLLPRCRATNKDPDGLDPKVVWCVCRFACRRNICGTEALNMDNPVPMPRNWGML